MHINDYLTEGIAFFKDSKRLKKIADKIEKSNDHSSAEVGIVISKIRGIAAIFENIEKIYSTAKSKEDKEKINRDYEVAKTKYANFIKMINRETFVKALSLTISPAIIAASIFVMYKGIEDYKQLDTPINRLFFKQQGLGALINSLLVGTFASTVSLAAIFTKFFSGGDTLFNETKEALSTLEKTEKMKSIKKINKEIPKE